MRYITDQYKDKNFSMDYLKFGRGKKILVILPGLSVFKVLTSAEDIVKAYELFADEYTVYLFERKNEMSASYSIAQMAEDTSKAIMGLGLSDIYLFGASQGGMIALSMAIRHPGFIKKLAVGSTSARVTEKQFETIGSWISLAKEGQGKELYLDFARKLYPQNVYEEYESAFSALGEEITESDFQRFIVLAQAACDFDILDKISGLRIPMLALGSYDDKVIGPEGSIEISRAMEDKKTFKLFMYDGYGHASFDTAPDYKERLFDFFNE